LKAGREDSAADRVDHDIGAPVGTHRPHFRGEIGAFGDNDHVAGISHRVERDSGGGAEHRGNRRRNVVRNLDAYLFRQGCVFGISAVDVLAIEARRFHAVATETTLAAGPEGLGGDLVPRP
jgi:hypothetical protein